MYVDLVDENKSRELSLESGKPASLQLIADFQELGENR
jgi:hypothetical protein